MQVPRSPLIVEELLVISSSMGTKLKLLEPAVLCVLAVSCSDGLETGAPVVFQWVKYTDVFGQNYKKFFLRSMLARRFGSPMGRHPTTCVALASMGACVNTRMCSVRVCAVRVLTAQVNAARNINRRYE